MREPLAQLLERTFSATEREVIYRLIRGRGEIRRFATDPIPMETLQRILDAAMDGPSARDLPPCHLILVTSPALRATITAAVAEDGGRGTSISPVGREPERSETRRRERMAEAPLHLAVAYDCARGGPARLDCGPRPSTDMYRIYGAIQNLWLAACAEGLGVEWLRLADEGAVARLLGLPPGVQLRRGETDHQARRRLDARMYTDIWGQTGAHLAAVIPPTDAHAPRGEERPRPAGASCERRGG
jgi:5,6-dimethylbenzimidazole synthase